MDYKYLPHTADVKFKAFGSSLDGVFRNCALAMFNILGKTSQVKSVKKKKIKLKTNSVESLLYDFLEELLFLFETEKLFLHDVKEIKISDKFELTAVVVGDNLKNYELNGEIKAVTYNDMSIRKTNKGYEATVVVDI